MARQFKLARQFKNLKAVEAAELLGVSQPTLSAWETGRKSPSVDSLEKMADLYGVTTDFLLGRTKQLTNHMKEPLSIEALPVMHGYPVWSSKFGWMLVDAVEKSLSRQTTFQLHSAMPVNSLEWFPHLPNPSCHRKPQSQNPKSSLMMKFG